MHTAINIGHGELKHNSQKDDRKAARCLDEANTCSQMQALSRFRDALRYAASTIQVHENVPDD